MADARSVFSRLYITQEQRHSHSMNILETAVELLLEIARTILVEAISGRVRRVRFHHSRHTMKEIGKYLHIQTRRKLLNRLSTGEKQ